MASFPVNGFGMTTNEALNDARSNARRWTEGDDRWIEEGQEYQVWEPYERKKPAQVQCTLWLRTADTP